MLTVAKCRMDLADMFGRWHPLDFSLDREVNLTAIVERHEMLRHTLFGGYEGLDSPGGRVRR